MRFNEVPAFACNLNRVAIWRRRVLMIGALVMGMPLAGHTQTMPAAGDQFNNAVPIGDFPVDIYVNGNWTVRGIVHFVEQNGRDGTVPCFDSSLLARFDLGDDVFPESARAKVTKVSAEKCVNLREISDGASYRLNMSDWRLDVGLPQAVVTLNPQEDADSGMKTVVGRAPAATSLDETVLSNVATASQFDGAARLMTVMSAASATRRTRLSNESLSTMDNGFVCN